MNINEYRMDTAIWRNDISNNAPLEYQLEHQWYKQYKQKQHTRIAQIAQMKHGPTTSTLWRWKFYTALKEDIQRFN